MAQIVFMGEETTLEIVSSTAILTASSSTSNRQPVCDACSALSWEQGNFVELLQLLSSVLEAGLRGLRSS